MWQNKKKSKCDETQKLKMWHNSKTKMLSILSGDGIDIFLRYLLKLLTRDSRVTNFTSNQPRSNNVDVVHWLYYTGFPPQLREVRPLKGLSSLA